MKPTKQLIWALRETAQKLRKGSDYNWGTAHKCNCGLLAQTLLEIDSGKLWEELCDKGWVGTWTGSAQKFCKATKLTSHTIFRELYKAGVEKEDYRRIEFLDRGDCENPEAVADWMDREADTLERRRVTETPP